MAQQGSIPFIFWAFLVLYISTLTPSATLSSFFLLLFTGLEPSGKLLSSDHTSPDDDFVVSASSSLAWLGLITKLLHHEGWRLTNGFMHYSIKYPAGCCYLSLLWSWPNLWFWQVLTNDFLTLISNITVIFYWQLKYIFIIFQVFLLFCIVVELFSLPNPLFWLFHCKIHTC